VHESQRTDAEGKFHKPYNYTCVLRAGSCRDQEYRHAFHTQFAKSDYRAGTQSWRLAQDLKGFIYFANNDSLLVYDGVQWQVYRMPNLSMVRSVYIDYTGEVNAKFRGNTVQLSLESGAAGTYIW